MQPCHPPANMMSVSMHLLPWWREWVCPCSFYAAEKLKDSCLTEKSCRVSQQGSFALTSLHSTYFQVHDGPWLAFFSFISINKLILCLFFMTHGRQETIESAWWKRFNCDMKEVIFHSSAFMFYHYRLFLGNNRQHYELSFSVSGPALYFWLLEYHKIDLNIS